MYALEQYAISHYRKHLTDRPDYVNMGSPALSL